ncbi:MAG: YlcI/YnfO family protein [Pirellulaceae bacterium]
MSTTLSLRLPNSIHKQLKEYAEQDGISMNQFISTAVAEKLASLATMEYLEQRAQRGSKDKFNAVLAKVPDVESEENDKLGDPGVRS